MNRQYIGARYVPKIYENSVDPSSMEWEANTNYEPLTEVTYRYSTYISKKGVPNSVGNPSENPTYWAETGAYNGQIQQLQDDVRDIKSELEVISPKVNRKWAIVTDSYGSDQEETVTPFTELFGRYMGLTYGIDFAYYHMGGAGFAAPTVHFTDVLDNLVAHLPSTMSTDDITDLIIAGGCNDSNVTEGLDTAIQTTVAYAKTLFPNAVIYIAEIGNGNSLASRANIVDNVVSHYIGCISLGAIPLQNTQYVMCDKSLFIGDGIHPNNSGMVKIAEALVASVCKGFNRLKKAPLVLTGFENTVSVTRSLVEASDDVTHIMLRGVRFTYPALTSVEGSLKVATFTNDLIFGNIDYQTVAMVSFGTSSSTTRVACPILFTNGAIYISVPSTYSVEIILIDNIWFDVPTLRF